MPNPSKPTIKPNSSQSNTHTVNRTQNPNNNQSDDNITKKMVDRIRGLDSLKSYNIRKLVKDAEEFGPELKGKRLETNQIRKFLDAINQIKNDLSQNNNDFSKIEIAIVMLKPKLAYAAARQEAAKPLNEVMQIAIDKVHSKEDFDRLVQLIESIIAYHKAAGGK